MYPQDENEAGKFAAGLIKSLHSDDTRDGIMKALTDSRAPIHVRIATIASNIVTAMLMRVKQQAQRPPHIKLILNSLKLVITELSRMALIAGIKVSDKDKAQAAKLSGDMIESGEQGGQRQPQQMQEQPQQQPQPQGLIGGAIGAQ
jgi:hypothetical protein